MCYEVNSIEVKSEINVWVVLLSSLVQEAVFFIRKTALFSDCWNERLDDENDFVTKTLNNHLSEDSYFF